MKPLTLLLLFLCILLQFTSTRASFSFTLTIFSHSTSGDCDTFLAPECETFFHIFCLRGPRGSNSRSTSDIDCPFGRNGGDLRDSSGSITIASSQPWQGGFQLFFRALDDDGALSDADHLADIFIDRDLAVGTEPTAETYISGRITLEMGFRVECLDNYYGNDCAVLCVEQNSDEAGHYTCNAVDGSRVCRENYYGPNCATLCQESNNEMGGFYTCDEDDGSFICNQGFTGDSCTENIDYCVGGPCENGGTCNDMIADFACDCPAGYTGETCSDDIDECLEANCPGNSTCVQDAVDSFLCQCNPGFEGVNCTEIQPCDSATCNNGGTCVSEDPFSYGCLCPPGFNGTSCENDIDECYLVECMNGGTCVTDEPLTFECVCPEGYSGLSCEFDVDECLLEEACPVGTSCINDEPGFRCVDASQQVDPRTKVTIIGSAVGGSAVIIIALICIVLIILLMTRRKMKYYRGNHLAFLSPRDYWPSLDLRSHPGVPQLPPSPLSASNWPALASIPQLPTLVALSPLCLKLAGLGLNPSVTHPGGPLPSLPQTGGLGLNPSQLCNLLITWPTQIPVVADRSHSHIYEPGTSPTEQVKCVGLSSNKEGNNPLYGTQIADTFIETGSPVIHTFENSIYDATPSNQDRVIYDQIGTNAPKLSTSNSSNDVAMSANISYESLRSPYRKEAISNPLYATTGGNAPPPAYSVPKPVSNNGGLDTAPKSAVPPPTPGPNDGLQEMNGYTILKDARSDSSAVPAPSQTGNESIELQSKENPPSAVPFPQESSFGGADTPGSTELGYALPAAVRSASREGSKYKKLQHAVSPPLPPEQQPVVRLAALPNSGYTALETES